MTTVAGDEASTARSGSAINAPSHSPLEWSGLQVLGLVALAIASVLVRLPFFNVPLISDEGGYAYIAHFWSLGYRLYSDLPFDRPQGIFLIYRAILWLIGTDAVAIRTAGALCGALTLVAVFVTARAIAGQRAGWIAAALFCLFATSPSIEGFTANAELFANLPLVIAAYLTWRERWAWAGLCAGLTCLVKPSGVAALILALAWALFRRAPAKKVLACCVMFSLSPLASALHGLMVGWDAYFTSLVRDRFLAFSVVTVSAETQWARFAQSTLVTMGAWAVPAVLAVLGLRTLRGRAAWFGVMWLASSLFGMSLGGNWYWHYYMQLIPPLAVFGGAAGFGRGFVRWLSVAMVGLALLHFLRRDAALFTLTPKEISFALYQRPAYLGAHELADYVIAHTRPTDTIYVAFSEAHLYYLTLRRAAVPEQMYLNQAYYSRNAFEAVLRAIEERRPAIVILAQPAPQHWMSNAAFRRVVERNYQLSQVILGVEIYLRRKR